VDALSLKNDPVLDWMTSDVRMRIGTDCHLKNINYGQSAPRYTCVRHSLLGSLISLDFLLADPSLLPDTLRSTPHFVELEEILGSINQENIQPILNNMDDCGINLRPIALSMLSFIPEDRPSASVSFDLKYLHSYMIW
jgi:hypothetical protein